MQKATITIEVRSVEGFFEEEGSDIFRMAIIKLAQGEYTTEIEDLP